MPGKVNLNSGQGTTVGIFVKVNNAWHGATSAFVNVGGTWKQWFKAAVVDSFNRTTSGSLGAADSGQTWNAVKGIWFANGTQAQSSDAATNYSIATIDTGSANNVQTIGTVSNGVGAAQWVADSGDWYGVVTGQEIVNTLVSYSCGCGTCSRCVSGGYVSVPNTTCSGGGTSYYTCQTGTYCTGSYQPQTVCTGGGTDIVCTTQSVYVQNCVPQYGVCSTTTPPTCTTTYTQVYQCNSTQSYSCGCSTCTSGSLSYPPYLYVLQSIAGTVTQVFRQAISAVAASLKVATSGGNSMTITTYSDSLITPTDSPMTYTASSTQTATQFGILLAPSQYNQGNTLDNYQSQNN